MNPETALAESSAAEATNAIVVAHEAIEKSHATQLLDALKSHQEDTLDIFTKAMRNVLTTGDESTKKLLIQKIPLLCTDILTIKADIKSQTSDIALIKKIGSFILAGIGSLFLTLVAALLLKAV